MTLDETVNKSIDRLVMSLNPQQWSDLSLLRDVKYPHTLDDKVRLIEGLVVK